MHVTPTLPVRRLLTASVVGVALLVAGAPAATADPLPEDPVEASLPAPDPEPDPDAVAGVGAVPVAEVPVTDAPGAGDADAGGIAPLVGPDAPTTAALVPAAPTTALPALLDVHPGYQRTVTCDPVSRAGVVAFAQLVAAHYQRPRYHLSRTCKAGDSSQHYDGRALDWPLSAYVAEDRAIANAVNAWLTANGGAMAKRFGIMYIIWNRQIWYAHRPGVWEAYSGPSPHTDHIHFSFTWDGALRRTSWWTGRAVTAVDHGPCRVYEGQYAPRYTARRTTACPASLPAPPRSPYPVYLPGAVHAHVQLAQASLGLTGADVDGVFGPRTLAALLDYQRRHGLPVTGVLDNATWVTMQAVLPRSPFGQVVASPDLTADGRADVVGVDAVGRLHVYPGDGTGRLGRVRPFGRGWDLLEVHAPGDWDGDGHADLMAVDGTGRLLLYANDGAGGFLSPRQVGHGWTGFRVTPSGDMDQDGNPDLLAIDPQHRLWLYPGDGRGSFRSRVQVGLGWGGYDLYAAGDANGDGRRDVLGIDSSGRLWYYAGRGGGTFARSVQVGLGWTGYTFASGADFNGDGRGDLMGRDAAGRLWFYAGRPGGTFAVRVQVGTGW